MHLRYTLTALAIVTALTSQASEPTGADPWLQMPLANSYDANVDVEAYWKSEKLDGIRAMWTGNTLLTRSGNPIHAPKWFTQSLPDYPVEGELWAGRGRFHIVQQTVMDTTPHDAAWKQIDFMLFDLPTSAGNYQKRYYNLIALVETIDQPHIRYVEHTPIGDEDELLRYLDSIDSDNGEGVMLRKITSRYQAGRSTDLLKLKKYQDTEAQVLGHKVGKGKYTGMLGALLVKLPNGIEFYIGSGFNDEQRRNPPPLGSTVTFRYNGLTQNGVPKFARFIRVHQE